MTTLTQNQLQEFIKLYKKYFWKQLDEKEALEKSMKLLGFTQNILFPNRDILWKK